MKKLSIIEFNNKLAQIDNEQALIDAHQALIYQKQEEIGDLWEEILAILGPNRKVMENSVSFN